MGIIQLSDINGGTYLHYTMLREPHELRWCVAYIKDARVRYGLPHVYRVYHSKKGSYIIYDGHRTYLGYIVESDYKQ